MRKVPTLGLIVVGAALAVPASAKPQPAVAGDTKLQRALDELAAGAPARSRSSATATARSATSAATET